LNKLISDTNDDKLFWELETKESLERIDMGGKIKHSLFTLPIETDKKKFGSAQPTFLSKNFQWFTAIAGNCYKLQLKNGSNLFLMKICNTPIMTSSPRNSTIEIWITMKNKKAEFISDTMGENVTSRLTEILYTAVNENAKHPKIDKGIRYIIDAFMEDDWDDDVNDN
ncbi:MAG: hypothetical protein J6I62_02245, partial [Selenomonadaceae bacterium]|nr:hypothetical protein [Selenomonadaceae bacterium]